MLAWSLPESAWWPLSRLFGEVNAATHPERTRNETAQVAISSSRHAGNDRPAPRCRRKLGQSLRGTLPLYARLAPWRLGAGNRHPWRRACLRGIGQGARHHLLGGQFQLQRPHRQDRLAAPWTGGQSFQPPDPRLLHHALRRPLPQRGAARHRGPLSRRAAHGRGPRNANGLAALARQPQGEWRDLDHRRQQGAPHGAREFPRRPHHSRHRAARHGADDRRCGVAGVHLASCDLAGSRSRSASPSR